MSSLGRRSAILAVVLAAVLSVFLIGASGPAAAEDDFSSCLDQEVDPGSDGAITCEDPMFADDGGFGMDDDGIPGWFGALFVLVFLAGIGLTIWRVTTARQLAADSGMDQGLATQVALLSEGGLDATYLAANLRQPGPATVQPATTPAPAATRLAELKGLLDGGLITQAEYDQRRTAIINAV